MTDVTVRDQEVLRKIGELRRTVGELHATVELEQRMDRLNSYLDSLTRALKYEEKKHRKSSLIRTFD
jgi:hypothetical protein